MSISKAKCPNELITIAASLGTAGRGILAADESVSMAKLSCCEDSKSRRRVQRELLLCTPGAHRSLNGVVLSEEALDQKTADGKSLVDVLKKNDVLVGIMIKGNPVAWGGSHAQKFQIYHEAGARFAVWGDGPAIDASEPSQVAIDEKAEELAQELARFASCCQQNGLVPILHPKLSFDKPPSTLRYANFTKRVLMACLKALNDSKVLLKGTLLMLGIAPKADPQVIARNTFHVLEETVPPAIPAILFLSSGQSEEKALTAMNKLKGKKLWDLSSFFGPPPQQRNLKAWAGEDSPHSPLDEGRPWKRTRRTNKRELQLGEGTSKSPCHEDYKY